MIIQYLTFLPSHKEESTRCNAVYSHIADREAVYEELPYSSDQELAIGHAKVSSKVQSPIEKCARAERCAT